MLEGPPSSVLRILKHLSKSEDFEGKGDERIQSGAVVYNVEDRPARMFPEWYSSVVQEKKASVDELTEENCKDVVHEMAVNLMEIGKGLQAESSEDIDLSRYSYRIPGKTLILALSSSPLFFSLHEYVELYAEPFNVDLESEQTWPLERLVNYS